ncbi:MAG: hypothetical protein QF654_02810 [Alphaproteobacteria bacterium]|nr:hypothetical protein [Alphaproteobacteria bacterium]
MLAAGLVDEAADMLRDVVRDEPAAVPAWHLLFTIARTQDRMQQLVDLACAAVPSVEDPEGVFLVVAQHMKVYGYIEEATALFRAILARQPDAKRAADEYLRHIEFSTLDDEAAFDEYRRWNERFIRPLIGSVEPARTDPNPDRPLRIGFVSSDFATPFNHSLIWYLLPWFHDTDGAPDTRIIYSDREDGTVTDDYLLGATEKVVDVFGLGDRELGETIRTDRIDIVIDLLAHRTANRMLTYAFKPAPIVVGWAAANTIGASEAVDYLLTDDLVLPPETIDRYLSNVVYLERPMSVWHPPGDAPDVGPPPHQANGHISFGNLNRLEKISPQSIELWAEVLRQVPGATMTFKDFRIDEASGARIAAQFEDHGIPAERLIFLGETDHRGHLAAYNRVDVLLDNYPFQAGISRIEALWMGVPVISYCYGQRQANRSGFSHNGAVGLPELATTDPGDYVKTAVELAGDRDRLVELRTSLRRTMLQSPLCDERGFAEGVKRAFREMWRRYCAGEPPAPFAIADLD